MDPYAWHEPCLQIHADLDVTLPTLPRRFGRYYLLERIATGGMGEIYAAVSRAPQGFGKLTALKTILPHSRGRRPDFAGRFRDEGRLVISMNHPNVVTVYEMGQVEQDEYYLAMELVEGKDLGQLLTRCWRRQIALPLPAALYLVLQVLEALAYCHRHTDEHGAHLGLIHRDVSPANVLVSYDGHVKLADFGLAKSHRKLIHTQPQVVLGKPGYMAPERLLGTPVDHRADLFAAGVLLFELLTCERFAPSREPEDYLSEVVRRSKERPSMVRPDVPAAVDELVRRATAFKADQRFADADAFADAVQRALVACDPCYGARQLSSGVMHTLFHPAQNKRRLQNLLGSTALRRLQSAEHGPPRPVATPEQTTLDPVAEAPARSPRQVDLVDEAARLREEAWRERERQGREALRAGERRAGATADRAPSFDRYDPTTESRPAEHAPPARPESAVVVSDSDIVELKADGQCGRRQARPGFGPRSSSALRTLAAMPPLTVAEVESSGTGWRIPSGKLRS
jgi:serine/threonine protein kinase